MTSNGIIGLLRHNGPEIRDRFRVRRLAVFGSVARMQEKPDSDVDVLVEFEGEPRFDQFMDLKFYLEEMLGRRVDLVTPQALKPRMARVVQQEAVNVA